MIFKTNRIDLFMLALNAQVLYVHRCVIFSHLVLPAYIHVLYVQTYLIFLLLVLA